MGKPIEQGGQGELETKWPRREDGSINLHLAWLSHPHAFEAGNPRAKEYFSRIESMQPIHSRQAAAVAIAAFIQLELDREKS